MTVRPVILIVDDEIANIELMGAVLEEEYEVLFARSGEQAIELAKKAPLDLILLDVVMPGLDGYETCRRIKQDPALADVPIIFTTGLDSIEYEVKGLSAGAIDYVTKPVQPVSLRRRVGNHINLKQTRDRLARQAMIDPLTGLGNRRMLETVMAEELARLSADRDYLSVIVIDIDYFKQFNDLYGHLQGDHCIAMVAGVLGGSMRRSDDLCVRYGGEEFACALPSTDFAGAMHLAEVMREKVEALAITHEGSSCARLVTISAGVASRRCGPGAQLANWLEQADRQLYHSKSIGRNQVSGQLIGDA